MATSIFSCAPTNASDAQFRDWGSKLSAAIQAVGFVKTSDTGQINWTTVLKPAGINTIMGYEVFRFNDALQSTAPVYIKVDYGFAAGNASNPRSLVNAYKATDGAGNMSGQLAGETTGVYSFAASSTSYNCYVSSGNDSMLGIAMWPGGPASVPTGGVIERSHGTDAVATAIGMTGLHLFFNTTTQSASINTCNYSSGLIQPGYTNKWHNLPPALTVGLARGTEAAMFPQTVTDGVGNWWQPRGLLAYMTADAPTLTPVSVPGYGTYLPLGAAINTGTLFASQVSSLAMRWE